MNTDEGSQENKSALETRIENFKRVICEALEIDEANIEEFLKEGSKNGAKKNKAEGQERAKAPERRKSEQRKNKKFCGGGFGLKKL